MNRVAFVTCLWITIPLGPAPALAITSIAAFGDSITAGDPWVAALRDVYDVVDLGQGGETTGAGLLRLDAWLDGGVGPTDVVTLLEGTNDVFKTGYSEDQTIANLHAMAADVLAAGLVPVVVAPPPIVAPDRTLEDERLAALSARLADEAHASGMRFVDLRARFAERPDLLDLYQPDGIHPNASGNLVVEAAMREGVDNCPEVDNPDQADADSDGRGDLCECGDVSGDGFVSVADAVLIRRALARPPTATLARPELCDVGGAPACSVADAAIILRSVLVPPRTAIEERCTDPEP